MLLLLIEYSYSFAINIVDCLKSSPNTEVNDGKDWNDILIKWYVIELQNTVLKCF